MDYRLKKEYPVVINRNIVVLPKGTILRERESYSIVSYLIEGVEPETYFNRDVPQNNPEWFERINFPFNYSTLSGGVTFNFYVEDGEKDNVIIGAKHRDDIIVTESAWREIGKRKGWSL